MKVVKSSDYQVNNLKESESQFVTSGIQFCEAIENADGVPFQLIFGPEIGEGYYLNVGEGVQQLLGIEQGDLTEKLFHSLIEEIVPLYEHIPSDLVMLREKFVNGEIKKYKAEVLVKTPTGEKKWIFDSSLPLKDEETGKVIGSFGILFDISERKNTLVNLEHARQRADESDRLKTAFLQNISHEVRTPLNAIIGFSTLLCEQEQDLQQKERFLEIINYSTSHFLEIMDNILEVSKLEANGVGITLEPVNLIELMKRVYDQFSPGAREKGLLLHLKTEPSEYEITLITDRYKLFQIINYLMSNALKFTLEGSVEFGYIVREDKIEFFVSDTGIGIAEQHKPNVFNRFYQAETSTTRSFPGTGLGLSITKSYVELLDGNIWFKSQQGAGSTFCFALPFKSQQR